MPSPAAPPRPPRIFVSSAIEGDIAARLGMTHYSYYFAAARFLALLRRRRLAPTILRMPEYYATRAAMPDPGDAPWLHLIFRSTDGIRLLKPAVNICCFAWEFPVLKTQTLPGEHPFLNQHAMLSLCDEIWTPSTYAAEVLRAHGLDRVHHIPAPVPLPRGGRRDRAGARAALRAIDAVTLDINPIWPERHQDGNTAATTTTLGAWLDSHARDGAPPTTYLTVLNPEDFRKNLDPLLRGFHHFRALHPEAVLIVKALTSARRFALGEIGGSMIRRKLAPGTVLRDRGIAVINQYLTDADLSRLYSLADFYLCASLAEGQNLPLIEAIGHGTVAVTTRVTAMRDYIDDTNAYVIATRPTGNDNPELAGTIALRPFAVESCAARDVMTALRASIEASRAQRAARAEAGIAAVQARFSEPVVWRAIAARLAHHAGAPRGAA